MATNKEIPISGTRTVRSCILSEKRQHPRDSVDMPVLHEMPSECVTPTENRLVTAGEKLLLPLPPMQPRTIAATIKAKGHCLVKKRPAPEHKSVRSWSFCDEAMAFGFDCCSNCSRLH